MEPRSSEADAGVLPRFYAAFAALDAAAMQACYADDARFEDPVFTLQGAEAIGAMWAMLCAGARAQAGDAWRLEARDLAVQGDRGQAHWEAWYRFGPGGRPVHNVVDARFVLSGGRISAHHDHFAFWRWSRQALGTPGWLLGWSPMLRERVRAQAAARLAAYRARAALP